MANPLPNISSENMKLVCVRDRLEDALYDVRDLAEILQLAGAHEEMGIQNIVGFAGRKLHECYESLHEVAGRLAEMQTVEGTS